MTNVIPLNGRRTPSQGMQTCRQCGGAWFLLMIDGGPGAIAFDPRGAVMGYAGVPTCRTCGAEHDSNSGP
jgi:hypothetical protein